jgi:hypothetical protein
MITGPFTDGASAKAKPIVACMRLQGCHVLFDVKKCYFETLAPKRLRFGSR